MSQETKYTDPISRARPLLRVDPKTGELRARRYELEVVGGPDQGKRLVLEGRAVVGTQDGVELKLSDSTLSRQHLELTARADGVLVRDLGSTNGTLLGGLRLKEALVEEDTTLVAGRTPLLLRAIEEGVPVGSGKGGLHGMVGTSPAMLRLFAMLERVATSDSNVLLIGETGTGKELAARALHQQSERRGAPFVAVNCSALAHETVESELFGHVKGAFTGAVADRAGLVEQAHGGTLLFDEVGDLKLELQPQLLRLLETGTFRRVGDSRTRRVDVRVVATSQRDLETACARGEFRQDLYFRLAVVQLSVPPLRDRMEDVPVLIEKLLAELGGAASLLEPLSRACQGRGWPGNVRELKNTVQRWLAGTLAGSAPSSPRPRIEGEAAMPFKEAKDAALNAFTLQYLEQLLRECGGNISEMSRRAGVTRHHMRELLTRQGLRPGPGEE